MRSEKGVSGSVAVAIGGDGLSMMRIFQLLKKYPKHYMGPLSRVRKINGVATTITRPVVIPVVGDFHFSGARACFKP
jgi:hypothetical protein